MAATSVEAPPNAKAIKHITDHLQKLRYKKNINEYCKSTDLQVNQKFTNIDIYMKLQKY